MHPLISQFEKAQLKKDIPEFRPGDTIRVSVRIREGDKERVQDFEGVVIRRKAMAFARRSPSAAYRSASAWSASSASRPRHRRHRTDPPRKSPPAKLYYLRSLRGKKARISERKAALESVRPVVAAETRRARRSPCISAAGFLRPRWRKSILPQRHKDTKLLYMTLCLCVFVSLWSFLFTEI
jgi:large subunit ribosomal protein L19